MRELAATATMPRGPEAAAVAAPGGNEARALPSIEAFLAPEAEPLTGVGTPDDAFGGDWTLDQAAPELEALGQALAPRPERPTPAAQRAVDDAARYGLDAAFTAPVGPAPMAPWRDDEFVEILPPIMAAPRPTPTRGSDGELPASRAAAAVLEDIAQRVRRGELTLPGYVPGMGDAAALAATLTALLASRQG
jgi:hypothetical protein